MRLTCPCCGALNSIEALLADAQARAAVAAALQLPGGLGDRILRYVGLFRPAKNGLSWERAAKLLTELHDMIKAGEVSHDGISYAAPLMAWQLALDQMLAGRDKLALPLKTHGYLVSIIAGYANKVAAQAEQAKHQAAKARGKGEGPVAVSHQVEKTAPQRAVPPEGWKERALKRVQQEGGEV